MCVNGLGSSSQAEITRSICRHCSLLSARRASMSAVFSFCLESYYSKCWWSLFIVVTVSFKRYIAEQKSVKSEWQSFSYWHQLNFSGKHSAMLQLLTSFPLAILTISVLQAYGAVITEYAIPSDSVRKSTVPLQIKISTAPLNFLNRNVIIFWK